MVSNVKASNVHETSQLYTDVRVSNSNVGKNTIVGNFSRVDFSNLDEYCRIDRNNHLYYTDLGRHTYTGLNTVIMHAQIGEFCSISWNVSIGGADHDYSRMTQHSFLYNNHDHIRDDNESPVYDRFSNSLIIGSDVWIAAGAVITRGINVGHGAVIGANSVVTKDVPPYAIVVGSPAKIVKYRFSKDIIDLLLVLEWWRWPIDKIKKNYHLLSDKPTVEKLRELLDK